MRKLLHRVAPYARRIRAVADVAGPALHVLLFLPRPRWANRLLLGASAVASIAGWAADAAAGEEGDWRLLPLGPAADLAAGAVLQSARLLDRRGLVAWVRLPPELGGCDLIVRQRDQREPREVFARDGEEVLALEAVRALAWRAVGGLARLSLPGAVVAAGEHAPTRPGPAGAAGGVRLALWPAEGRGATVVLAGPRGSQLVELARVAAAMASAHDPAAVGEQSALAVAAGARVLEVRGGADPAAVAEAVAALQPRLLLAEVGAADHGGSVAEVARLAAQGSPGCAVALICPTVADADSVGLRPGDSALTVDPGDAEEGAPLAELLGVEGADPGADRCSVALAAATSGRSFAALAVARREADEAARRGLRVAGAAERVTGWPPGFAVDALRRVGDASSAEEVEAILEGAEALADAAVSDWLLGAEEVEPSPQVH